MKKSISATSRSPYGDIRQKLKAIFSTPRKTKKQRETTQKALGKILYELDQAQLDIEPQQNSLSVERAAIVGEMCLFLKDISLRQHWTKWAAKNLRENIGTLQKYMAIAQSRDARRYGYLGVEMVYELTRIEHLLGEHKGFEGLFCDCGLETHFNNYSCGEFEMAVNMILNKETLNRCEIEVTNEMVRRLTENIGLIEKKRDVLSRLAEGQFEEANLEKVITTLVSKGVGIRSMKRRDPTRRKLNVNRAVEVLIQELHGSGNGPQGMKEDLKDRLRFLKSLLEESLRRKVSGTL